MDPRKRQTATATPAKPGGLPLTLGAFFGFAGGARSQTPPAPRRPPPILAPAAPATVTLPTPGMAGSLAFSAVPNSIDVGPLGKWYVDGVLSGLGVVQSNPVASDTNAAADMSNGQVIIQKLDGIVQFYAQIGAYSIPALGTQYSHLTATSDALNNFYGPVPQGFLKIAPTNNFSIEAGKLPTLIGAEYTFTFENFNIERGLLWNQEPAVSRGVQANYMLGLVAFSLSLNDGYYSGRYNWVSGSATWTINSSNTLCSRPAAILARPDTPPSRRRSRRTTARFTISYTRMPPRPSP